MLTLQQKIRTLINLNNFMYCVNGELLSNYDELLEEIKELEDEKLRSNRGK